MKFILFFILFLMSQFLFAQVNSHHVYVKGHTRSDGTYVNGHYRTAPNSTNLDNFSTKGNVNPYTGKSGWIQPDYTNKSNAYPANSAVTNLSQKKVVPSIEYEVELKYSDGFEYFNLCDNCNIIFNNSLEYYWYNEELGIQHSTGKSQGELLDGKYVFYDNFGKLKYESSYFKGLEHGDYFEYDSHGNIITKIQYKNGVANYMSFYDEDGYKIVWNGEIFKDGSTKSVFNSNDVLVEYTVCEESGVWETKIYNDYSGNLESAFKKSIFTDEYVDYYQSYEEGKLIKKIFFNNGLFSKMVTYDENGEIDFERIYFVKEVKNLDGVIIEKGTYYLEFSTNNQIKEGFWKDFTHVPVRITLFIEGKEY